MRKEENRFLLEEEIDLLKGTKFLWLFAAENLPEKMAERFAFLRGCHLKTGRAWAIKESLRELWSYRRRGWAQLFWQQWYFWATHSRLQPVKKVARMIHTHLENVLTYFEHRITNAVSEGLLDDSDGKKNAYGYRNRDHLRTAIFFHCGGLDLHPPERLEML